MIVTKTRQVAKPPANDHKLIEQVIASISASVPQKQVTEVSNTPAVTTNQPLVERQKEPLETGVVLV